ncbi:MAG TPA: AraC family transcriptional regulator [Clostridiaceae bacterium]|nr:AraC family transcriptional regulator [Clostridiaceae bacterium]
MSTKLLYIDKMKKEGQTKSSHHFHDFWQLEITTRGNIIALLEEKTLKMSPGDMLLIKPGLFHQFIYEAPGVSIISIKFSIEDKNIDIENEVYIKRSLFTGRIISSIDVLTSTTVLDIYEKKFIEGHLDALIFYITSEGFKQSTENKSKIILDIMAYIKSQNGRRVTINELAEKFSYSRSHLSKIFKQEYGMSLKSYIDTLRLEKAKEMLAYSERTISEIAHELDFKDIYTFSRFFKRNTGLSPKHYRKTEM